ncbi:META domain-containing protein [Psychrobacter aestuarii]|uniref:DUF306 domain-containing protein n=1 Tax=Psychrobacter aestuarii TaxID=556327 RepID=A0ABN0VLP8_9GAMM|nr:META domain-containing protein [Psychrobacter aestuarii]
MKTSLLASAVLCTTFTLSGCQSMTGATTPTTTSPIDSDWSETTLKPRLFQTATSYNWQLTQVSNDKGKLIAVNPQPPLTMNVRPDALTFDDDCYQYHVSFYMWMPLPYPYKGADLTDTQKSTQTAADCTAIYQATIKDGHDNIFIPSDTADLLNTTFEEYTSTEFTFEPIATQSAGTGKRSAKQLALKTNEGKTLVFTGTPKPEKAVAGIPLTNDILEDYHWQLIQVTDAAGATLSEFTQTEHPITMSFNLDGYEGDDNDQKNGWESGIYGQSFGISTGCNGIGGPYALSTNQTLLMGGFPSTMMSCSDAIDDMESRMRRMVGRSQLTLTYADSTGTAAPNYVLTQQVGTGETLLWQNIPKKVFNSPADNNDDE